MQGNTKGARGVPAQSFVVSLYVDFDEFFIPLSALAHLDSLALFKPFLIGHHIVGAHSTAHCRRRLRKVALLLR